MRKTALATDLTEGNVARQLVSFSIPFLLANLLQTCYSLTDMMIVGRVVGSTGLSAISNGGDLQALFTNLGVGFTSAGQIIVAQYLGAKDEQGVRNTIGTLFTSVFVLSLGLMALGLLGTDFFLTALQVPAEAYSQAKAYCVVTFTGMVFIYGYNAVSAILRGIGDSRHPLCFVIISTSLNVLLDLIFVAGLGMGARGAALATVIGQAVAFLASLVFLYRRREDFGFDFTLPSFRPKAQILKTMFKMGIPLALRSTAIQFSMLFVTSHINSYGVAASAITGVGNKILNIATMVTTSLEMAGSSMVGQNFGAGKLDRVKKVLQISLVIGLFFNLLLAVILLVWPEQVFRIWTEDPEVLALVPLYLPVAVLQLAGFALRSPCLILVSGIGFVSMSFVVGILDGVVFRIGLALLFGDILGWGICGYWYGTVLAGFTACFIIGPYYFSGAWKKRRPVTRQ